MLTICLIKSSLKFNFRTKRKISFKFLQQFEVITKLTFVRNDLKQLTTQPINQHMLKKKEFHGWFVLITTDMRNETINPEYHNYLTNWPSVFHILRSASWIISLFRALQAKHSWSNVLLTKTAKQKNLWLTYLANLPIKNASKEFKVRSPTFTWVATSFFTGDKVIIACSARQGFKRRNGSRLDS